MLSILLTACTDVALKGINTPSYIFSNLRLEQDLPYGETAYQKLDLYLPGENTVGRKQLIVFIYGGSWLSGTKGNYYFVADALTSAGYAVAIPDYVKYPQGKFPTFVEDVALSIAWLSQNVGQYADIEEFILMGHSAGAHIGALLITDPSYLAVHQLEVQDIHAFVGLAGPYAFTPKEKKYRDIFANLEDYSQMQPLHFVSGSEPPALLLHGAEDSTVLPAHTQKFAKRINTHGGTAHSRMIPERGHIELLLTLSRVLDANNSVRSDILDFLQNNENRRGGNTPITTDGMLLQDLDKAPK